MTTPVHGLPVGSVSINGPDVTVSYLLNNPRIIDQRLAELANLNYWADRILPNVGATSGGVIITEKWTPDTMRLDREAEELAPGAEVPLGGISVGAPMVVRAKVDGEGYQVTREHENRNRRAIIDRYDTALANNIADNFNRRAVAVVKGAIVAESRVFDAPDWSAIVNDGANPTPKALWPHSTLALLRAQQQEARIPFTYDVMLAHALDVWRLNVIYNGDLSKLGVEVITDTTGDVERGKPILAAAGGAGGTAWEQPVKTEVIDEPRRRRKVVQATGSAAYYVDNPYGLLQLDGVAEADIEAEEG